MTFLLACSAVVVVKPHAGEIGSRRCSDEMKMEGGTYGMGWRVLVSTSEQIAAQTYHQRQGPNHSALGRCIVSIIGFIGDCPTPILDPGPINSLTTRTASSHGHHNCHR